MNPDEFNATSTPIPGLGLEEEQFKKQMQNYYQDLQRAQKAQADELTEIRDRLQRCQEEKAKYQQELKSKDAMIDTMMKNLAAAQDEVKLLKDRSNSHEKETERLMASLASSKEQITREREQSVKVISENHHLKNCFGKAEKAMDSLKRTQHDVTKVNAELRGALAVQAKEFEDLRSQWLSDHRKLVGKVDAKDDQKLLDQLSLAETHNNALEEMMQVKTKELENYKDITAWFEKESKQISKINEMAAEIRDILAKRSTGLDTILDTGKNDENGEPKEVTEDSNVDLEYQTLQQKCKESEQLLNDIMSNGQATYQAVEKQQKEQQQQRSGFKAPNFNCLEPNKSEDVAKVVEKKLKIDDVVRDVSMAAGDTATKPVGSGVEMLPPVQTSPVGYVPFFPSMPSWLAK